MKNRKRSRFPVLYLTQTQTRRKKNCGWNILKIETAVLMTDDVVVEGVYRVYSAELLIEVGVRVLWNSFEIFVWLRTRSLRRFDRSSEITNTPIAYSLSDTFGSNYKKRNNFEESLKNSRASLLHGVLRRHPAIWKPRLIELFPRPDIETCQKKLTENPTPKPCWLAAKVRSDENKSYSNFKPITIHHYLFKEIWTGEEDIKLKALIDEHGTCSWTKVGESFSERTGKQCRERWYNHLDPSVKKGEWTAEVRQTPSISAVKSPCWQTLLPLIRRTWYSPPCRRP